jgi:hypothetical protein
MAINRLALVPPAIAEFNTQGGTSYTFISADANLFVQGTSGSATTFTIAPDSTTNFPIGTSITIIQAGAGQITVAAGAGVTLNGTPGLRLRAQWSTATITKRANNTWIMYGDVIA